MRDVVMNGGPARDAAIGSKQYVTFSLNNEHYAFEAQRVQEIVELMNITRVPHLPEFLKGVINLRGTIIPVIDLKTRFGMESTGYQKHTCVVVTAFSGGVMGVIVDSVSDVLHLADASVDATPAFGGNIKTDYITGIGKVDDSLVLILDADRVLSDEEAAAVAGQFGKQVAAA